MLFEKGDRLIFAGDSVAGMGHEGTGEGLFEALGRGYVRVIENLLEACYPQLTLRITNAGVSGNTSRDLLARFDRDVVSRSPQWGSICIGINDGWRQFDTPAITEAAVQLDEYERNVEEMILRVKDNGKGIFLMTPYYMEPNQSDPMRARMDEDGAVCRRLAEKHGCRCVDFQAMYDRFFVYRHSSRIAWDRVHPNQIGATLMAREFLKHCDFDYNNAL